MNCPQCGEANAAEAERCRSCGADVTGDRPTLVLPDQPSGGSGSASAGRRVRSASFESGHSISARYRIVRRLGEGGMGAVYLAHDAELDRDVALKLVHTDLVEQPAMLERFKREIQLSSRITHKNVLRVYDLGEADGVKFLTMQYVEGEDLASVMRREGRLPLDKAVDIFRQMAEGLRAAHEQGVIHRDLKPQNIMIESSGRVAVTDFGLAKSHEQTSLTDAGKIVGTPHYMSPEQVKGVPIDHRSDVFSLGIILYEMLTGAAPFAGSSAYEIMISRVTGRARPALELNPDIPPYLLRILDRCLETDPEIRYQSLEEVLRDLDAQKFHSSLGYEVRRRSKLFRWSGAVVIAVAVIASLTYGWRRLRTTPPRATDATHKPVSVLIADLDNRTGEQVFDGTLEPVLTLALEGASFINSYNRVQAHKVAAQIRPGAALDEATSRLVAAREGINVIITGSVARDGDAYALSLKAIDGITGKPIDTSNVKADNKEKMLATVGRAAADLRAALGDTTPTSAQLAAAETFTAGSLEAAHEYAVAQDLFYGGKFEEAAKHYEEAVKLDPNLGRAYAGLAASYSNMGRRSDAEKYYRQAMAHIDRMTEREKYRTRGTYYLVMHNTPRAIEELTELVKQYPSDMAGLNNLALAYFYQRDMTRALEASQKPIELYPKNAIARNNAALYAMYAGEFDTAQREAGRVLQLNSSYRSAYVAIALSQLARNDVAGATATYRQLATQGARGESMSNEGLADLALYEGRTSDAAALLRDGIKADVAAKRDDAANRKIATLADITADAASADSAVSAAPRAEHTVFLAARALIAAGKQQRATAIASQLGAQIEPEPQHYGKLIEGEVLLRRGNAREALNRFEEAKRLGDSWLLHFDRGLAYLDLKAFTEANADFENCLNRAGEATAAFLDDAPTFHLFPPVHYYLGRAREGLGSAAAADSYRQFLAIKTKGDGDPLVADARRRLSSAK